MKIQTKLIIAAMALALGAAPALALGPSGGNSHIPTDPGSQGQTHQGTTPGPHASFPSKRKAYGLYCQGESKRKDIPGTSGKSPFAICVTDMAKAAHGLTPSAACKNELKHHVTGMRRSPYAVCVSGAEKLLKSQSNTNTNNAPTTTDTTVTTVTTSGTP
jgi:hypothetical protein